MDTYDNILKTVFQIDHVATNSINTHSTTEEVSAKIYKILTHRKFRINKISADFENNLQEKILTSIKTGSPITLIIADGGFKNYRFESAPHINWAEIFHISWVIKNLLPIAQIYKPGVLVEFSHDAEACVIVNNYKESWIKTYCDEFDQALAYFSLQLPDNFILRSKNFTAFYEINEIGNEIDLRIRQGNHKDFPSHSINSAMNNYCFDGDIDQSNLSKKSQNEVLKLNYQKCTLWLNIDYEKRREYLEGGINIPVLHKKNVPNTLPIYSTYGCIIQYWIGIGVLANKGGRLIPWILSYNQFSEASLKSFEVTMRNEMIEELPVLGRIAMMTS